VAARRWYGRDRGLTTRIGLTLFGLGLIYVVFIGVLIAAGVGAIVVLVLAGVFALVQLFFGDKIALASMRARVTEPHEAPELHGMIERLCQLADLPKPRVAIAESEIPNAFAAGRSRKSATVCVTTGIMERLDTRQLEGVIAHELSHIANRDVVVMTVAGFLATVAGLLVRMGIYSGMMGGMGGGRGRDRDNGAAVFLIVILVSVVVYAVSFLLLRALSRYREYAADRGSALMTGAPAQLASALVTISGTMDRIPTKDLRAAEGLNAFFIIPAVAKGISLSTFFSTHPPVEKRIERLMAMQATLDASPSAQL
jgi:heat shock protein HtpX